MNFGRTETFSQQQSTSPLFSYFYHLGFSSKLLWSPFLKFCCPCTQDHVIKHLIFTILLGMVISRPTVGNISFITTWYTNEHTPETSSLKQYLPLLHGMMILPDLFHLKKCYSPPTTLKIYLITLHKPAAWKNYIISSSPSNELLFQFYCSSQGSQGLSHLSIFIQILNFGTPLLKIMILPCCLYHKLLFIVNLSLKHIFNKHSMYYMLGIQRWKKQGSCS